MKSSLALLVELIFHMAKGNYGEDDNRKDRAQDKLVEDPSPELAAEECSVQVNELHPTLVI